MARRRVRSFLLLLALFLVHRAALAQSLVHFSGRVFDPQGAAVPKAEITLRGGGSSRTTASAADGGFSFEGIGAGTYALMVSASGFAIVTRSVVSGTASTGKTTLVERVEVLKGPSSALYGGGALGATVNIIRTKPSELPSYDFSASGGSWGTWRGAFGAGGRIGSQTMYRLDVGGDASEGYRHNDATRFTVTPSLAWRVGNDSQLNVYYTFNRDWSAGDVGLPLVDSDLGVPVADNLPDVPLDRNYRTPQDDATSLDHNLQVVCARQLTASW